MKQIRAFAAAGLGCMCLSATLSADTIVLRDGRRVEGDLVAVHEGVIEFDGQRSGFFGGRERLRIDRDEVVRIELDERREARGRESDSGRDRSSDVDAGRDRDQRERPSGLRERDVSVDAAIAWKDTGIDLRPGQTVYFSAVGRVRWGPGRQDGPEGEHGSPYNAGRPIPGRAAAALVGRVGEGSDYFFIGDDKGAIRVRSSGRLYLGINDDFLKDNSGSFRVTVYY
ncbi:MAG TPA: hypothetical protein VGJ29_08145 [Vicinamibacterales bacterium]